MPFPHVFSGNLHKKSDSGLSADKGRLKDCRNDTYFYTGKIAIWYNSNLLNFDKFIGILFGYD